MKRLLFWALLILNISALSAMQIAKNGKACCDIVVSDKRNEYELRAALDLQKYLQEITGAKFEIYSDNAFLWHKRGKDYRPAIFIGDTSWGVPYGMTSQRQKFAREEWRIFTLPGEKGIFILGGKPIGTYYGVWQFLKKLGCLPIAWDETCVPKIPDLKFTRSYRGKPTFESRYVEIDGLASCMVIGAPYRTENAFAEWLLRVGANRFFGTHRARALYDNIDYHIPTWPYHQHSLCYWVNPAKYFKDHPEYYAMRKDGKRYPPRTLAVGGSLCMSNPEVSRVTYENIKAMILKLRKERAANDQPRMYNISILDNSPDMCYCANCQKVIKEGGANSALLLLHINRVARMIGKEFPEIMIHTHAYAACDTAPDNVKVEKNVIIEINDSFPKADCFRPITSKFNDQNRKMIEKWVKTGAKIVFSDYTHLNGGSHRPQLDTVIDTIKPDYEFFAKNGGKALLVEMDRDHVVPQPFFDLTIYLVYEFMFDVKQDPEVLINAFLRTYYGKAAPVMHKYLQAMRAGMKAQKNKQTCLRRSYWTYLTPEFLLETCVDLHKAAAMYPQGSKIRRRIETELLTVNWVILLNRERLEKLFKLANISMDDLYKECIKFSYDYRARMGGDPNRNTKPFDIKIKQIQPKDPVPVPALFKGIAPENIKVLAYHEMTHKPIENAFVGREPGSPAGRALKIGPKAPHGVGRIIHQHRRSFPATLFALENVVGNKQKIQLEIKNVPQDEKYHWYRMPGVIVLEERSWFWGFGYSIDIDTNRIYTIGDGASDHNKWECRFSVKFTGPAYVKGSKKENAIYIDYVVLTRPGQVK